MADSQHTGNANAKALCAHCDKPATNRCVGCLEGVNDDGESSPIYYCGKDCQRDHWKAHKSECHASNERKKLFRLGALAKDLFYFIRRETWSLPLTKVEAKDDRKVHLYEREAADNVAIADLPTDGLDEQQTAAVLTRCSGKQALVWLGPFVHFALLQPSGTIQEIGYLPKVANLTEHHTPDGETLSDGVHYVLPIKVAGKLWAFDVAGAQFSWHRVVTPWQLYESTMIHSVINVMPFKTLASHAYYSHKELVASNPPGKEVKREVKIAFLEWFIQDAIGSTAFLLCRSPIMALSTMLQQPADRYMVLSSELQQNGLMEVLRRACTAARVPGRIKEMVADMMTCHFTSKVPDWQNGQNGFGFPSA